MFFFLNQPKFNSQIYIFNLNQSQTLIGSSTHRPGLITTNESYNFQGG
jgi:hypothetical protein